MRQKRCQKNGHDLPPSVAFKRYPLYASDDRAVPMVCPRIYSTDLNRLRLLGTFGEGCPKGLVIWAVMQLSRFRGYLSDRLFNSIH
jgi:hypothetical protein